MPCLTYLSVPSFLSCRSGMYYLSSLSHLSCPSRCHFLSALSTFSACSILSSVYLSVCLFLLSIRSLIYMIHLVDHIFLVVLSIFCLSICPFVSMFVCLSTIFCAVEDLFYLSYLQYLSHLSITSVPSVLSLFLSYLSCCVWSALFYLLVLFYLSCLPYSICSNLSF